MIKKVYILIVSLIISNSVFAQFDTITVKTPLNGETWEWKIEGWDATLNHDLVVDYTFTEDAKFVKYQRVETQTKPYNEVKVSGTWKKNGQLITFISDAEGTKVIGEFNPDTNPSIFMLKIYKLDGATLIKEYSRDFIKLPVIKRF